MSDPTGHSKFSPSGAKRWLNCPGYLNLAAKVPPEPDTEASMIGTAAHELAASCLTLGNNVDIYRHKVWKIKRQGVGGVFEVPNSNLNLEGVQGYVDKCRELMVGATEYNIEETLDGFFIADDFGGTSDFNTVFILDKLIIGDYKNGRIRVYAHMNEQMLIYALMKLGDNPWMVNTINIFIYQPNHGQGEALDTFIISVEDLYKWRDEVLIPGIKAANDPNAPLTPGPWCKETWCQFHRNQTCPALLKGMFGGPVEGERIPKNAVEVVKKKAEVDLTKLSGEELDRVIEFAPIYKALIAAAEAEGFNRLLSGDPEAPKTQKLVQGRGSRAWALEEKEVIKKLSAVMPEKLMYENKLRSVAQIEKKLKALDQELDERLVVVNRGLTMVHVNDKRKEYKPETAEDMFGDDPFKE